MGFSEKSYKVSSALMGASLQSDFNSSARVVTASEGTAGNNSRASIFGNSGARVAPRLA
jgi:hypothetical protein